MNTFGNIFRLTSFGESHGEAIGGVIDGCPSGIPVDKLFIQNELNRRKPGQSPLATPRREADEVEFLSGIYEGKTTGTPVGFIVKNTNAHALDYDNLRDVFRPSHADYTYQKKYGIRDHRGGGRSSARETIARVVAGAFAKLVLRKSDIEIVAYTSQVGTVCLDKSYTELDLSRIESSPVRCPDPEKAQQMIDLIETVKAEGDTVGGVVSCVCRGVPAGLGEPVFGKLHAALGNAMLSINAVKGFEYGMGFEGVRYKGSEMNDAFYLKQDGKTGTKTNHSGGIQGGISNGEDIYFRVAFKPVATIFKVQQTVDKEGNEILLKVHGRHDPCVLSRAVPVVEAMAAMVILDYCLLTNIYPQTSGSHPQQTV
ncbi:MAG: chorismate synthase [Dysgonamonadaceae bacterium]|jgi:chorismate synthase|nr:chorismate synthase [Dysgonamonadaceae bacterium]